MTRRRAVGGGGEEIIAPAAPHRRAGARGDAGRDRRNVTFHRSAGSTLGKRIKTKSCVAQGALPDPACTLGDVLITDATVVCTPGYSARVRAVSSSTKAAVYAEYGITSHPSGAYKVDHHVSVELSGSNGIANLWPEPAEPRPGFHEKDQVENFLHQQVCSGMITLPAAQATIATNWLAVYRTLP